MKVIKLEVSKDLSWQEVKKYIGFVCPERQKRIARFRKEQDKVVSLIAELLIRRQAAHILAFPVDDIEFGYHSHGKPYIKNAPDYHFSISHSNNCIVFVDGDCPVGIDVEYIKKRREKVENRFFTHNECEFIEQSANPDAAFFQIWTSKEACVKMLGVGLSKPLDSFDVISDEWNRHLFSFQENGYCVTVCFECEWKKEVEPIAVNKMSGNELLSDYGSK